MRVHLKIWIYLLVLCKAAFIFIIMKDDVLNMSYGNWSHDFVVVFFCLNICRRKRGADSRCTSFLSQLSIINEFCGWVCCSKWESWLEVYNALLLGYEVGIAWRRGVTESVAFLIMSSLLVVAREGSSCAVVMTTVPLFFIVGMFSVSSTLSGGFNSKHRMDKSKVVDLTFSVHRCSFTLHLCRVVLVH